MVSIITGGIWITLQKQWKVQKVKIRRATFVQTNTFLQLRHVNRIHLTLLSTTCVKIHQISYAVFETISTTQVLCMILA